MSLNNQQRKKLIFIITIFGPSGAGKTTVLRCIAGLQKLLLLDEPLSVLDAATREHVRSNLAHLLRSLGIPAIVVTHDWVDALTLGDRMLVMSRGRVLQTGLPREVFARPQHREVASAAGVETVAAGVAILQVGSAHLTVADPGDEDVEFWVCNRGEDATLEKGRAEQSSAPNKSFPRT